MPGRITFELRQHSFSDCLGSDWGWSCMECAAHVMSHALYMSVCKYAASRKLHRSSSSSLSRIGISSSQIASSIGYGTSEVTDVSGLNSVGEDKSMMFNTYYGTLPIHLR